MRCPECRQHAMGVRDAGEVRREDVAGGGDVVVTSSFIISSVVRRVLRPIRICRAIISKSLLALL